MLGKRWLGSRGVGGLVCRSFVVVDGAEMAFFAAVRPALENPGKTYRLSSVPVR